MKLKGHGKIRKSKAYGTIGVLALTGALLFGGNTNIKAEETAATSSEISKVAATPTTTETSGEVSTSSSQASSIATTTEISTVSSSSDVKQGNTQSTSSSIVENADTEASQETTNTSPVTETTTPSTATTSTSETTVTNSNVLDTSDSLKKTTASTSMSNTTTTSSPASSSTLLHAATGGNPSSTTASSLVEASVSGKTLTIHYNGTVVKNETVKFAVWSALKGQDDLVWYDANAAGAAYVDLSKHRDYGKYYVHTYSFISGQAPVGLNGMSVTVAQPEVKTTISKTSTGNFDIVVTNVPDIITSVTIPVWSAKQGQDDLKWYSATKVGTGSYKVSVSVKNHHNDNGHYFAHIYGQSSITGSMIALSSTSGFDNVDSRPNATVSVVNYAENKTSFDVVVSGSSATKVIKAISVAVWSEGQGQDDLKWYQPSISNNKGSVRVNIANHLT